MDITNTDHARQAAIIISHINPDEMGATGTADWIAVAQVHATLAVAEKQHQANRIALAVAIRKDILLGGDASELSDWLHDGNGVRGYFSADEQDELGIG